MTIPEKNPRLSKLNELEKKEKATFAKSIKVFKQLVTARNWCSDAEVVMNLAEHEMLLAKEMSEREDERIQRERKQYYEAHQQYEEIRERCKLKREQLNCEALRDEQQVDEFLQKSEYQQNLGNDLLAKIYFHKSQIHGRSYELAKTEMAALDDEIAKARANTEKQAPNPPNAGAYHKLAEVFDQTKTIYEQALTSYEQLKKNRDELERAYNDARVEYVCIKNKYRQELTRLEVRTPQGCGCGCNCGGHDTAHAKHEKTHYDSV